jgi:hypothetical protein
LPDSGLQNGRYKVEVSMLTESGEQKDQKADTFEVSGYEKEKPAEKAEDEK